MDNLYKTSRDKNLVNMSLFCIKLHFVFASALSCTLSISNPLFSKLHTKIQVGWLSLPKLTVLSRSQSLCDRSFWWRLFVVTLLLGIAVGVGAFVIGLSQISSFFYLKSVNYKALSEYSILIGQFPSNSVKVSRKIRWSSHPSKFVQVLWWTLIKVFFDRLHCQSSRQKLWPRFLVYENFKDFKRSNIKHFSSCLTAV